MVSCFFEGLVGIDNIDFNGFPSKMASLDMATLRSPAKS